MSDLTKTSNHGKMRVNSPIGFERMDTSDGTKLFMTGRIKSTAGVNQGDAVQYSGGYIVSADNAALPHDFAGVALDTIAGTASTSTDVTVDQGLIMGDREYKVLASDAALTSTDIGLPCMLTTSGKVLFSGAKQSSGQFICTDVLDYTNKIVKVRLNRGEFGSGA